MVSPDTDVFVLLVYHFSHMGVSEVFFKTGRKSTHADLTRFIPIHNVKCKLNKEQTNILLSVYALTGCDTCCALFGIGKKKAFKTMMTYSTELQELADIGKFTFADSMGGLCLFCWFIVWLQWMFVT